jgi:hypothetical protein
MDERDGPERERNDGLAAARAALRAERDQLARERAEAARILRDARATHREAERERARAKRLAGRFVSRVKTEYAAAFRRLEDQSVVLASDQERLASEKAHFEKVREDFHAGAAAARERIREAWNLIKGQQKRSVAEWTETNRFFAEQAAILDRRRAELTRAEKGLVSDRARMEAETAGLREEASALEARIEHARTSLAELEAQRERIRNEVLGTDLPAAMLATPESGDLPLREERLAREKAAVAALRAALEAEAADVNDRRRMLAEQFGMLAEARSRWQQAERRTVLEMEELAQALRHREHEIELRELRLMRDDSRRREDAYDLWQLRLRLEAWQTRLTAFEVRWHTERERLEIDYDRRVTAVIHRETELERAIAWSEKARSSEREQVQATLELWADDRQRLSKAMAELERQRQTAVQEMARHASRAIAAEQIHAEKLGPAEAEQARRRIEVLRRWWERAFDRQTSGLERLREELVRERTTLDERYLALQELHTRMLQLKAAVNSQCTGQTVERLQATAGDLLKAEVSNSNASSATDAELNALRNEVDRLANVLMDMELPEAPDPPPDELPWGIEEPTEFPRGVLPYPGEARAA